MTQYCKLRRNYDMAFVWKVTADSDRFLCRSRCAGMDFTRTTKLHIHWLEYLRFCERPLDIFTASAFPRLRFFSGGLNVNLGNIVAISHALLHLPAIVLILNVVHREQLQHCPALRVCCQCPDDARLCVRPQDCSVVAAFALWQADSHETCDIWRGGTPVLHLNTKAQMQGSTGAVLAMNLSSPAMQGASRHPSISL